MADKHTKRELFENLLIFANAAEADTWVIEGLEHELDLLNRKRSTAKGDAKKKAEQDAIKRDIADVLADSDEPMKATPISDAVSALRGEKVAVQRVSALLKQMKESGEVARIEDKKETFFTLA